MLNIIAPLAALLTQLTASPPTEGHWLRHPVRAYESLEAIAHHYKVPLQRLLDWNPDLDVPAERGELLRIPAGRFAPPTQRRTTRVRTGDTWASLASEHGVRSETLRLWNRRYAKRDMPPVGKSLTLWVPTGVTRLPSTESPVPTVRIPEGGVSVGLPQNGRLKDGIALPPSDLYTVRFPAWAYGTSLTIQSLIQGIQMFRDESGFSGPLYIGALSRQSGRKLKPHRSHQSGRDADVRLPALPPFQSQAELAPSQIDWAATWALVEALLRTERVEIMFLERPLKRRLREAAYMMGASDTRIREAMRRIHDEPGHDSHVHVRFICNPSTTTCRSEA